MLFSKKDSKDAETFWKEREEAIGTSILGKTLGRVILENSTAPLWGLFYTTSDAIYFQTFKSDNWISMLLTSGKGSGRTKDEIIEIRREALITFEVREKKGGLLKLFKQPPMVELTWKSAETGETQTMLFEMEGDAKAFVETFPGSDRAVAPDRI